MCGSVWIVDRQVAGRPPRRSARAGADAFGSTHAALPPSPAGLEASWRLVLDQWAQFRRCPTCGHDDFWQEPLR